MNEKAYNLIFLFWRIGLEIERKQAEVGTCKSASKLKGMISYVLTCACLGSRTWLLLIIGGPKFVKRSGGTGITGWNDRYASRMNGFLCGKSEGSGEGGGVSRDTGSGRNVPMAVVAKLPPKIPPKNFDDFFSIVLRVVQVRHLRLFYVQYM